MSYETIERGPHGDKLWRITECKACEGRGTDWHPGCGAAAANCGQCDGMGETARFKCLDLNGKPFGAWRTSD